MPGRGPAVPVYPFELFPAAAQAVPVLESVGAFVGGSAAADESDRPLPWKTSCLSMCWAVLDLFLAGARGLGLSDLEYKQVGPMKIARAYREHTVSKGA